MTFGPRPAYLLSWVQLRPHVLVDYQPKGRQAAIRQENRLCAGCAGQTTVLLPEFVGYWLYELVPDRCDEPGRDITTAAGEEGPR